MKIGEGDDAGDVAVCADRGVPPASERRERERRGARWAAAGLARVRGGLARPFDLKPFF